MENYKHSDYAANKYASGIIYRFANETVEVTLDDYLRENPGKTESDFAEIKAHSDGIYEEQARNENRQTCKNISVHGLEETNAFASPSPDNILFDQPELLAEKLQQRKLAIHTLDTLTEVQRRRFLHYVIGKKNEREIAETDGSTQQAVSKSLHWAEKKIKKYLAATKK